MRGHAQRASDGAHAVCLYQAGSRGIFRKYAPPRFLQSGAPSSRQPIRGSAGWACKEDTPAAAAGEDSGSNGCSTGVSRRIIQIRAIHVEQDLAIAVAAMLPEKLERAVNVDSAELGQHRFRIAVL